ncbi:glycosyltransferase [Streptomyces sp. NPDC005955]|uniref:glycosyltransferase n=1 Tax=Streptomyces sp. NPDC005955 TaxID=3364738 RepID=UPI0036D055AF
MRATPRSPFTPQRPWAWRAGLLLAAVAVLQQLAIAAGAGGWLPGWQPWPFLLLAGPLLWWGGRPSRRPPADPADPGPCAAPRVPSGALLAGLLVLTAGAWAVLQDHESLIGHEESVYGNRARSWSGAGTPAAGWGPYRPPLLPLLGSFALRVHEDVGALRVVGLLLALATVTVTYLVVAHWTSPRQSALVVLLLLGGLGFLRRLPQYLTDIGATGLLVVVVWILVRVQEKPGSRALWALPPVVLAAFYLRYGVVGNLLAIALGALFAYGPRAWAAQGRRLAVVGALVLLGTVPHLVQAVRLTGSPLGLLTWATEQAERTFIGDGLVYYLAILPYRLAGDLGGLFLGIGLVALVAAVRRTRAGDPADRDRRTVFLGSASALTFLVLGLATDGEPRFVYLPVVLLTVLGVQTLRGALAVRAVPVLTATAGMALLTLLGTVHVVAHGAVPGPMDQHRSTVPVARALAAAPGERCLLVTAYEPENGWYARCDAVTYGQYRRLDPAPGTRVSFIRFTRGREQPTAEGVRRLAGDHPVRTRRIPTGGSLGTATVVTLVVPGASASGGGPVEGADHLR